MTNYQDHFIFQIRSANTIVDMMFTALDKEFPTVLPDEFNIPLRDHFVLSGRAAAILQGERETPLSNIVFETDSDVFMNFIHAKIAKILNCEVVKYKNRTTFIANGMYFEIWKTDTINLVRASGIVMQNRINIPINTL